jgi:hypothetical protein
MDFHDFVLTCFAVTFGLILLGSYSWIIYCAGRANAIEIIVEIYRTARDR